MIDAHMRSPSLAHWLAAGMVAAATLNGAGTYLKRTGLVDEPAFRAYWRLHCAGRIDPGKPPPEHQCTRYATLQEIADEDPPRSAERIESSYKYIYESAGEWRILKLAKDLWWLVALACCAAWFRARGRPTGSLPVLAMSGFTLIGLGSTLGAGDPALAVSGLRAFSFLALALLGSGLAQHVRPFAVAAVALLVIQVALIPMELFRGIHVFHEWPLFALAKRVAGTMVHPNTLGAFAVAAFAFAWCFVPRGTIRAITAALALAVIVLSGSGTGLLCASGLLAYIALRRVPRRSFVLGSAISIACALSILALPVLTGREDIFDSIFLGRLESLLNVVDQQSWGGLLWGHGLGAGTNTALSLGVQGAMLPFTSGPIDSTLIGLVIQFGIAGALAFYFMLFAAAKRDRQAAPFFAVLAFCSLTINVTEVFPVNVLLGLALARDPGPCERVNGRPDER